MPGRDTVAFDLRLDEDDVDANHRNFVAKVLDDLRGEYVKNTSFSYTFRFDPCGTSHWHGMDVCVIILNGICRVGRIVETRLTRHSDVDVMLDPTSESYLGDLNDVDNDRFLAAIGLVAVERVMGG